MSENETQPKKLDYCGVGVHVGKERLLDPDDPTKIRGTIEEMVIDRIAKGSSLEGKVAVGDVIVGVREAYPYSAPEFTQPKTLGEWMYAMRGEKDSRVDLQIRGKDGTVRVFKDIERSGFERKVEGETLKEFYENPDLKCRGMQVSDAGHGDFPLTKVTTPGDGAVPSVTNKNTGIA